MNKNEIFTFMAPNGAKVTAVVVAIISSTEHQTIALCYAQDRLFTFYEHHDVENGEAYSDYSYGEILVDHAILPDYDAALQDFYQHEMNVRVVQGYGYTKAEASNILEGKNADGSDFEELPF